MEEGVEVVGGEAERGAAPAAGDGGVEEGEGGGEIAGFRARVEGVGELALLRARLLLPPLRRHGRRRGARFVGDLHRRGEKLGLKPPWEKP